MDKSIDEIKWFSLERAVQQSKIAEAFDIFRSQKIEPILIKGWAIARLYPLEHYRPLGDIDLCVRASDFQKAQKIIESEIVKSLNIDLHCGLRHLDTVNWDNLFENSRITPNKNNENIRILRPEDHLRVLCVHWLNDGGVQKEKLWDIYFAFKNELEDQKDFDWDRCLKSVSKNRRRWIICTIGLAEKYLLVSLVGTPFEFQKIEIPTWILKTVESEWKSDVRLKPLQTCLNDRKEFYRQIKKRFPPNPLQATIEMEGSFDNKRRIFYQTGSLLSRIFPSLRRISEVLRRGKKKIA